MLPLLNDTDDVMDHLKDSPPETINDALMAYMAGVLSKDGKKNREIRTLLKVERMDHTTNLISAGTKLSFDHLELWHRNSSRISLGHVRLVSRLPSSEHDALLRLLLTSKTSCQSLRHRIAGDDEKTGDMVWFEEAASQVLKTQVTIKHDTEKQCGTLSIQYSSLDNLDEYLESLGCTPDVLEDARG